MAAAAALGGILTLNHTPKSFTPEVKLQGKLKTMNTRFFSGLVACLVTIMGPWGADGCQCLTVLRTTCAKLASQPNTIRLRIDRIRRRSNRIRYTASVLEVFLSDVISKGDTVTLETNNDTISCGIPTLKKKDTIVASLPEKFEEFPEYRLSACNYYSSWKEAQRTADFAFLRTLKRERALDRCGCIDPLTEHEVLDGWSGVGKIANTTCFCENGDLSCQFNNGTLVDPWTV
eukprot:comp24263_c8_seq2/m.45113 comp24263_c8_seq2/g.45113  ORF comp24263_c8_seq2/g.45113 comp24263_c8_seq2/m.45113 type:complete len:232 (-) comp24263_c8_seq2:350-1045(-)